MTLFAPDETTSAPLGRKWGVRSMLGNCIFLGFWPLHLLFFVDVCFLTADLEGYLGLF